MKTTARALAVILVFGTLGLVPAPGWAAAKKAAAKKGAGAAAAPATPGTAREWFDKGSVHHKLGEYALAIDAYREAYKLAAAPVYLYNIAVAYKALGNDADALRYYQLYLADDPDSPLRPDVEKAIADLEKAIAPVPAPPPLPDAAHTGVKAPAVAPPATAPVTPGSAKAPPSGSKGLLVGLGVGGGALVVAGGVVVVLLVLLRPDPVARLSRDFPGLLVEF